MVEDESQGTFIPTGRQDILTTALGTPEHYGRVRTAGRGVGFKKYFRGVSRSQSKQIDVDALQQNIFQNLSQAFEAKFEAYKSQLEANLSQKIVPSAHVSTNDSCSPENEEDPKDNILRYIGHMAFDLPDGQVGITLEHDDIPIFYIFAKDLTDMSLGDEFWLANQHLQLWCT